MVYRKKSNPKKEVIASRKSKTSKGKTIVGIATTVDGSTRGLSTGSACNGHIYDVLYRNPCQKPARNFPPFPGPRAV